MNATLERVKLLVAHGRFEVSRHGYRRLSEHDILVKEAIGGVVQAMVVEDSPDYHLGPCVLVLQRDGMGRPIHVLWGIPKGLDEPASIVTAYRPDLKKWMPDLLNRRSQ